MLNLPSVLIILPSNEMTGERGSMVIRRVALSRLIAPPAAPA